MVTQRPEGPLHGVARHRQIALAVPSQGGDAKVRFRGAHSQRLPETVGPTPRWPTACGGPTPSRWTAALTSLGPPAKGIERTGPIRALAGVADDRDTLSSCGSGDAPRGAASQCRRRSSGPGGQWNVGRRDRPDGRRRLCGTHPGHGATTGPEREESRAFTEDTGLARRPRPVRCADPKLTPLAAEPYTMSRQMASAYIRRHRDPTGRRQADEPGSMPMTGQSNAATDR